MLDHKEEAEFADLRNMCRKLKVPMPPEIMIGLKVHDKNGYLIFDDIQRGHSWTRNFYNYCICGPYKINFTQTSFGVGYASWKNPAGTVVGNFAGSQAVALGTASSTGGGIVVGTSDTAFSVLNFNLGALISHGNGVGQFAYSPETAATIAYNAGGKIWTVTKYRIFNNNSGLLITTKEIGLMSTDMSSGGTPLWERSVLSPVVDVPNGAQLTVTYEIGMDFSSID